MLTTSSSFLALPTTIASTNRATRRFLHTSSILLHQNIHHRNQNHQGLNNLSFSLQRRHSKIETQRTQYFQRLFSYSPTTSSPPSSSVDNVVHVLRFDGVISTSYPYKAGAGFLLYHVSSGKELLSTNKFLGTLKYSESVSRNTSSSSRSSVELNAIAAQGKSLLLGMQHALDMGVNSLVVQGHSPLIQYHLQKIAQNNNEDLHQTEETHRKKPNTIIKDIYKEILSKMSNFDSIQLISIPKKRNMDAFKLAENAVRDAINKPQIQNQNTPSSDVNDQKKIETNDFDEMKNIRLRNNFFIDPKQTYMLRFDGGSRGNPGKAGAGFVVYAPDRNGKEIEIYAGSYFMGNSYTNNEAEYMALKKGIQCCHHFGIQNLHVEGDSDLVVKQVKGQWKCKKDHLQVFLKDVKTVKNRFQNFKITYIPRKLNSRADELANLAMDSKKTSL